MVDPIKSVSSRIPSTSAFSKVKKTVTTYANPFAQKDSIEEMKKKASDVPQNIKDLQKGTDDQVENLVKKTSLYTQVYQLYLKCNYGKQPPEDDNKCRLIVKELSEKESSKSFLSKIPILNFIIDFYRVVSLMKTYFSELSTPKMFFWYLFLWWIPELYIRNSADTTLKFLRSKLENGNNLPKLGSKVLETGNIYLANYNRTVERFRDDPNIIQGDKNKFITQEFNKPELLEYPSTQELYKDFAKATSREDTTSPTVRILSNFMLKLQLLKFEWTTKYVPFIRILSPITFILGIPFLIIARILESIPNAMIAYFHQRQIRSFTPTIMQKVLGSVSTNAFIHAINIFICEIIIDQLKEMEKRPEDKNIDENVPNIVNDNLSDEIRKFSKLIYSLLKNEPCDSREELLYLKEHGLKSLSNTESVFRLLTSVDDLCVDTLHTGIIEVFNQLFAKPERLEYYLTKFINLMSHTVIDPDTITKQAEINMTKKNKDALITEVTKKASGLVAKDWINTNIINSGLNKLGLNKFGLFAFSKNQRESLLISYRKIQKHASKTLPGIIENTQELINSSNYLSPNPVQTQNAKKDIQKVLVDIENLFLSINSIIENDNEFLREKMKIDLKSLTQNESLLKNYIRQIDQLHNYKEGLTLIHVELKKLKAKLLSFSDNPQELAAIKKHLRNLNKINENHQFDPLIVEFNKLETQLNKDQSHKIFTEKLEEIIKESYFTNNLLSTLREAQKGYLSKPKAKSKQQYLQNAEKEINSFLQNLDNLNFKDDINEIKLALKKIIKSDNSQQLAKEYENTVTLIRQKIAQHKILIQKEQDNLPQYFDQCNFNIDKYLVHYPEMLQETHNDLMKHTKTLHSTLETMHKTANELLPKKASSENEADIKTSKLKSAINYLGKPITDDYLFVVPLTNSATVPIVKEKTKSAYRIISNSSFYEGLIHAYMKLFIDYVKNKNN